MKYLFILGRNVKLSITEVFSFLEKGNIEVLNYHKRNNSILVEIDKKLEKGAVDKFGGVIAIGEVLAHGDIKKITHDLEKINLYNKKENKFNYVLWNFSDEDLILDISHYIKSRFKKEKLKASEKTFRGIIKLQNMDFAENVPSRNSIKEEYFLFSDEKTKENYFGIIKERCNYDEIEKRDMNKPVRRPELAISPRLAKIMINLSQARENEIILDPFCGIGVVLEEALLQKIKVIGIDNDENAINWARKNLEWFNFPKQNYELIAGDSRNIKISDINAIVTEPSLGKPLRKLASKQEAEKMTGDFEKLIILALNNLKNKISGRIVFTSPLIKTIQGRVSCNFENILKNTGLKMEKINGINFPIPEFREDQVVGRTIAVVKR